MTRLLRLASRLYHLALPLSHLLYALCALAPASAAAAQTRPWNGPGVGLDTLQPAQAVVRVGMTVADMERSLAFYTGVLQFAVVADTEVVGPEWEARTGVFGVRLRLVRLRLGTEELALTEFVAASHPGRPVPVDGRSNDRWFQHVAIITTDMDSAYRRLRGYRVRSASTGPQLLPPTIPAAAGIRAFYFRDPDGHALEVLQFPPDKGAARWQAKGALFLGIDHTAIVVGDTERSLAFYRDRLGLQVAGGSENSGTEQAHLNNVEGAHLRITALRAANGPGIEFLEYLQPRDGRPFPADARPTDLVHWETTLAVPSPDAVAVRLVAQGYRMISRNSAAAVGILLRDPDGHAIALVAP